MKLFSKARSLLFSAAMLLVATVSLPAAEPAFRVLVFSKTIGYRHTSITNGIAAIRQLGVANHFAVEASEDSAVFTPWNLQRFQVVVFLSTIGDILDAAQQSAFERWLRAGGGFLGIHAAIPGKIATEGDWPWYGRLLCTDFTNHSAVVKGTLHVEDRAHPSTVGLPETWVRTDEWYNFTVNPRARTRVLVSIDEKTYQGGTMGDDHPMTWSHAFEGGRVWYTALGHTESSFTEPEFLQHLLGAIEFAAGVKKSDLTPLHKPAAGK
jgi:type 1 glutamine amidotransferase